MIKKILIIIIAVVVVVGVIGGLLLLSGQSIGAKYTTEEKIFDNVNTLIELDVDVSSESIEVYRTSEANIKVTYPQNDKLTFNVTMSDGVLKINREVIGFQIVLFDFYRKSIKIYLPESILNNNIDCILKSSSGSITINRDLKFDESEVKSSSGSIKINDATFKELDVKASSGSITCNGVNADTLDAETGSGAIKIEGNTINKLTVSSNSGSIKVTNVTFTEETVKITNISGSISLVSSKVFNCDLKTSSGSIKYDSDFTEIKTITCNSSSGSVRISIPSTCGYKADYHTSSGGFHSEFGNSYFCGNEQIILNVHTSSGGLHIYKK